MSTKHWGEIPKDPISVLIPDVIIDIERSMNKCCLAEYEDDSDLEMVEQIILPSMDPLMLYAISLHKYINNMTEMIRVAELAIETNVIPPEDAAPPMPDVPEIQLKHKKNDLNYLPKDFTPFSSGWETDMPELSEAIVKRILTKSIATMFAHIGFETTHQSVLDVLFDVMESFFAKFCGKVVDAVEEEDKGHSSGFPNVIERVLTDIGMGGVRGIYDYYQNRVIKYIDVLQKRCKELNDYYATLLIPKNDVPTELSKLKVLKTEDNETDTDNPEVHLATFDGDTSVLEPGLELLNTLEAEENLQNMEAAGEEDISSAFPGVVSILSEADISNLSPYTKKKRLK